MIQGQQMNMNTMSKVMGIPILHHGADRKGKIVTITGLIQLILTIRTFSSHTPSGNSIALSPPPPPRHFLSVNIILQKVLPQMECDYTFHVTTEIRISINPFICNDLKRQICTYTTKSAQTSTNLHSICFFFQSVVA